MDFEATLCECFASVWTQKHGFHLNCSLLKVFWAQEPGLGRPNFLGSLLSLRRFSKAVLLHFLTCLCQFSIFDWAWWSQKAILLCFQPTALNTCDCDGLYSLKSSLFEAFLCGKMWWSWKDWVFVELTGLSLHVGSHCQGHECLVLPSSGAWEEAGCTAYSYLFSCSPFFDWELLKEVFWDAQLPCRFSPLPVL